MKFQVFKIIYFFISNEKNNLIYRKPLNVAVLFFCKFLSVFHNYNKNHRAYIKKDPNRTNHEKNGYLKQLLYLMIINKLSNTFNCNVVLWH